MSRTESLTEPETAAIVGALLSGGVEQTWLAERLREAGHAIDNTRISHFKAGRAPIPFRIAAAACAIVGEADPKAAAEAARVLFPGLDIAPKRAGILASVGRLFARFTRESADAIASHADAASPDSDGGAERTEAEIVDNLREADEAVSAAMDWRDGLERELAEKRRDPKARQRVLEFRAVRS